MTPSEKQKAIAVAFARYNSRQRYGSTEFAYSEWLLTEEGKRLTAEEPRQEEGKIGTPAFDYYYPASSHKTEEEVKWLRATMETQFEAYEALAKETAQDIKALKSQFDRFFEMMKGNL